MIRSFIEFKTLLQQLQDSNQAHPDLHPAITKHLENVSRKNCSFQQFADAILFVKNLVNEEDLILPQGFEMKHILPVTATELAPSKRVHATLEYCKEYKEHLEKDVKSGSDELVFHKYAIVEACIKELENPDVDASMQLLAFNHIFNDHDNRQILNTRRDTAGITFLKGVLTVLSLGIAWVAGLWNTTGGNMSENIDELENLVEPQF